MGVRSACALAHLKPEWVEGLILVDLGLSGPAGGGMGDDLAQFLKKLPQAFPSRAEARSFLAENCPDPSIAQYLLAVSTATPEGGLSFPFDHAALIQTIEAAKNTSVRGWVRAYAEAGKRVLILRGAESRVFSPESFAAEKAALRDLPSVEFEEVAGAGHGLPFEKRAWFVERVRAYGEG
jgi:pimeloyl-ACP methyl ester carboxylesterase